MGFETPEAVAQELKLFTENDGDIYRQQTTSILKNLATKKAAGKYDHDKAVTLFMYLTETGARKYAREFGGPGAEKGWHEMFPIDVRRLVAAEWRDEFEVEFANGSYDNMLPKKYQKPRPKHIFPTGHVDSPQEKRLATMDFYKGQRVSMHPATDAFMMGDRYGDVVRVGRTKIHVKMDKSGRVRQVSPKYLEHV